MTEWEQTAIMGKNETHFMWRRGESNIMIRLHNDYNRGACAKILEKLAETNAESYDGYGEDTWCEKAADLIRKKCKAPEAAVHFFPGGKLYCPCSSVKPDPECHLPGFRPCVCP